MLKIDIKKVDQVRFEHMMNTLEACHGNRTTAAGKLGVSKKTVYNMITDAQKKGYWSDFFKGQQTGRRKKVTKVDESFFFRDLDSVVFEHIVTVLTQYKATRTEQARALGISVKSIQNFIHMAEHKGIESEFLGPHRVASCKWNEYNQKPEWRNRDDEMFFEMPSNEQRLQYLDNPEQLGFDKKKARNG